MRRPQLAPLVHWAKRRVRMVAAAAVLLLVTVVAALAIPVRQNEAADFAAQLNIDSALAAAATASEDLTPLLDSERWGTTLRAALAAAALANDAGSPAAEAAEAAARRDAAAVRFVGYIAAEDRRSALLALPDGEVVRLGLGERLGDGRELAEISDRVLTLSAADDGPEVLTLFPPVASSPPAGTGTSAEGREGLAPRIGEPSAGEREGPAPRMGEQREGLAPRMGEPR